MAREPETEAGPGATAAAWVARARADAQPLDPADPAAWAAATATLPDVVPVDHPDPRVAVLVPVHDDGVYLLDALASVRAHAGVPVQVRVIDDASTDPGTRAVLELVRAAGVAVLAGPGVGVSGARNVGLADTTAPYVLPLDCDNLLRPGFLADAVAVLDARPEVAVVHGDAWRFGAVQERWAVPPVAEQRLVLGNYVDSCAVLRRGDLVAVGGWDPAISEVEDWDLWLSLLERGRGFHRLDRLCFDYRVRPGQLTARHEQLEVIRPAILAVVEKHRDLVARHLTAVYGELVHTRLRLAAADRGVARLTAEAEAAAGAGAPTDPADRREPVDRAWYLATYPDVAAAGVDPQVHYDRFGRFEGRAPRPDVVIEDGTGGLSVGAATPSGPVRRGDRGRLPALPGAAPRGGPAAG